LLASLALGRFAVGVLSRDASFVCAFTHLDAPFVLRRVTGLRRQAPLKAWIS
jgi:hypothetical protein